MRAKLPMMLACSQSWKAQQASTCSGVSCVCLGDISGPFSLICSHRQTGFSGRHFFSSTVFPTAV